MPTTLRHAAFQVVAVQTTTGFCSADFDQWGFVAKATLLTLMFVGGCAGSTGGGLKVVRILICVKVLLAELEHYYRPKVVRSVRVGKTSPQPDQYILSGFVVAHHRTSTQNGTTLGGNQLEFRQMKKGAGKV